MKNNLEKTNISNFNFILLYFVTFPSDNLPNYEQQQEDRLKKMYQMDLFLLHTRQKEKVKFMRHYCYGVVTPYLIKKTNKFNYIFEIQNFFVHINYTLIRVVIKNCAIYFILTCFFLVVETV